ncbi:MAG: serine hydrolase [Candidatus Sericytochromatia bacterium]
MIELISKFQEKIGGTLGIYAKNLYTKNILAFNEHEIFPSASVIKIFILYTFFKKVEEKKILLKDFIAFSKKNLVPDSPYFEKNDLDVEKITFYDIARSMIIVSDNTSTNLLIDFLTFNEINKDIKFLGLKNTILQRKMYDFESREKGIDNFITPYESFLFLEYIVNTLNNSKIKYDLDSIKNFDIYNIDTPNYVSLATIKIMSEQEDLEKIPFAFKDKNYFIANKPGELPNIRNDVSLIIKENIPYIINIFTKNIHDELKTDTIISEIAKFLVENL